MKLTVAILAALTIGYAVADCPNACSGNGECGTEHDFCTCYDGFTGADCSQRVCAMGLAYIDTPVGDLDNSNHLAGHSFPQWAEDGQWEAHPTGLYTVSPDESHFYMECSNRGKCDRSSGICQCFTGFEGAACNRTTCASGCSGHGTCETIEKFAPDHVHYELWDSKKTRMCQCDGGWGGIDCSMRLCKKNDDPLTRTTTREGYNKGLAEAGEVQLVDFRCPYNGKILNPKMRLVYTDVNFGDKYATEIFNPIDATTDEIEAALRALPNGVLADYSVDGVVAYRPLTSVERTELEADKFYQLKVTFASYLGDVPLLEVEPLYECQGGLEVDALAGDLQIADNVKATYIGDGPSEDLIYEVEFTAANQYTLVVKNGAGVALGAPMTGQTYTPGAATVFDADGDFHPEAPKVSFEFSGTTPASNHDGSDGRKFILRVHTTPVVQVRNEQYTLTDLTASVTTTLDGDVALNTVDIIQADESDWNLQLAFEPVGAVDGTSDGWKFYLNGEFIGYVEEFTGGALSLVSGSTNVDSIIPAVITSQFTFDQTPPSQYTSQGVRALYTYEVPKEPVFTTATTKVPADEVLAVTLQDNIAVREHLIVVLQITQISGSPDRYQWKVAGDPEWHSEADIPAVAARLDDVDNYAAALDEEDPKRDVANLIIEWQNGVDNDKRKCAKNGQGALYYIQIGSNGLNDSPVCSDRGLCDYGTGECKCFKGYAGIDCSEQHALAGGAGGRSTAGL